MPKKCYLCNSDINNINSNMLPNCNIWLCQDCYNENVIKCHDCNNEILSEDAISIDILPEGEEERLTCKLCFDKNYVICKNCSKTTIKYETIWDNGYICKECQ